MTSKERRSNLLTSRKLFSVENYFEIKQDTPTSGKIMKITLSYEDQLFQRRLVIYCNFCEANQQKEHKLMTHRLARGFVQRK